MRLDLHPRHGELVLTGEFDLTAREELGAALDAAIELRDDVRLDLAAVEFLDGGSIRVAMRAHRTLTARGGHLRVDHASAAARRPIQLLGVGELLGLPRAHDEKGPQA